MDILLENSILSGVISAPMSKSDLHRKLICSALSDRDSRVLTYGSLSEDIKTTVNCLNSMGAEIKHIDNEFHITPINKKSIKPYIINCNESGSTLRFLLPVCAALGVPFTVTGSSGLAERPIAESIKLLTENGCTVNGNKLPLKINGRLTGNNFDIDGSLSSQFISGILLASPLLDKKVKINVTNAFRSKNYVDLTLDNMRAFSVAVTEKENSFTVSGKYHSNGLMKPEGDWSNSAFFLVAGAIKNSITVKGLNINSSQGDKKIINILKKCGATVTEKDNIISVKHNNLNGITVDASQIPDLVPVLAVLLSLSEGTSEIINAERLRFKETDRLFTSTKALNNIGAKITETQNGLIIKHIDCFTGGTTESFNDHRIAMAVAITALQSKNPVLLKNAEAVNKSYPDFFEKYIYAGGKANVIHNG